MPNEIEIDQELAIRLELEARRQGRSVAELVREAVEHYLPPAEAPPETVGLRSGFGDTSERADEVLAEDGGERGWDRFFGDDSLVLPEEWPNGED